MGAISSMLSLTLGESLGASTILVGKRHGSVLMIPPSTSHDQKIVILDFTQDLDTELFV
jgi:hypothetical protein